MVRKEGDLEYAEMVPQLFKISNKALLQELTL
jgi:hypothetical protein